MFSICFIDLKEDSKTKRKKPRPGSLSLLRVGAEEMVFTILCQFIKSNI